MLIFIDRVGSYVVFLVNQSLFNEFLSPLPLNSFSKKSTKSLVIFPSKHKKINMESKTFTFKYEPTISLKQMGEEMKKAVRTGKTISQPPPNQFCQP